MVLDGVQLPEPFQHIHSWGHSAWSSPATGVADVDVRIEDPPDIVYVQPPDKVEYFPTSNGKTEVITVDEAMRQWKAVTEKELKASNEFLSSDKIFSKIDQNNQIKFL